MIIPCRFSFVNVFEPKADLSGRLKYSTQLLIPKKAFPVSNDPKTVIANIEAEQKRAIEFAISKGKFTAAQAKSPKFKLPLRDGDDPTANESVKGHWFINASNTVQPGVVDSHLQPIIDPDLFYSGCYGFADVQFFGFNQSGNIGLGASLNNVMKKKEGERLDGKLAADVAFAGLEDDASEGEIIGSEDSVPF